MRVRTHLPEDYRQQDSACAFFDEPTAVVHQPHVYEMARFVAARSKASRIIDIGCGSGLKLSHFEGAFPIIGVDAAHGLAIARKHLADARFVEADLNQGLSLNENDLHGAVVICSDVIEHLLDPAPLARSLAEIERRCSFLFVSTPDRERARGLTHLGPPDNPAHVREWTAGEFCRFLFDAGFRSGLSVGYTVNNDRALAKTTILAVGGAEAIPSIEYKRLNVAAIMHVFNEQDILRETVTHLRSQGVHVHILDNWSTDNSFALANALRDEGLVASVRQFPDAPQAEYQWARQLDETAQFAATLDADWVMHHDVDEIRVSPWAGVTLQDAISYVDALGYSAIDFTVLDYRFLRGQSDVQCDFESNLTHFEFGRRPGSFVQIKAWKNSASPVQLSPTGGHEAQFPHRQIYPLKFLLKHYPLRNRDQAERKVFVERAPRATTERTTLGWHVHYDAFSEQKEILGWDQHTLIPWQRHRFDAEYIVERLTQVGLPVLR